MDKIKVYGANWCPMTTKTRAHLDQLGMKYTYIDVDTDPSAAQWVKDQNDGLEKKPTLYIAGTILTEPSNREVDQVLRQQQMIH